VQVLSASQTERDSVVEMMAKDMEKLKEAFDAFGIPSYDGHEPFAIIPEIIELLRCKENMILLSWKKLRSVVKQYFFSCWLTNTGIYYPTLATTIPT
jgi:hypothetical protein